MGIVLIALLVSLVRMSKLSRTANDNRAETTMMSAALQEALTRLKAQERAMAARAEASERLSNQIITGVGAGLIVVDRHGLVQIVNPAARRILNIDADGAGQLDRDAAGARGAARAGDQATRCGAVCRSRAASCAWTGARRIWA